MEKIVEGVVFRKARFLRTTCKNCGKDLTLNQVKQEKKWCSKKCNVDFQRKNSKRKTKHKASNNNVQEQMDRDLDYFEGVGTFSHKHEPNH